VIADDQTSVRDGLVALLGTLPDMEVVGAAADGAQVLEIVAREQPDAVLMDLRMPGVDGVEATERLARSHPDVAVVVLTTFADDETVLAALAAGASGYLTKDAGRADMARALHAAVAGQVTLASPVQRTLLSAALSGRPGAAGWTGGPGWTGGVGSAGGPGWTGGVGSAGGPGWTGDAGRDRTAATGRPWPDGLTDREGEILLLIAAGLTNRAITGRLFIGNATVKTHINRIFAKIGVTDRQGAIDYAVSRRLLTPGSPGAGPMT
jgi:DNA-binding NarL/FixJ family response regulator